LQRSYCEDSPERKDQEILPKVWKDHGVEVGAEDRGRIKPQQVRGDKRRSDKKKVNAEIKKMDFIRRFKHVFYASIRGKKKILFRRNR